MRERVIVAVLTLVTAASRLLAVSRAPWEWDEILFAAAVRDYDVALHHPHPPGFPLFIGAAKLLALVGLTEFRALQVIVVLGAMLLFPLTYALGRAVGLGVGASLGGGLLVAFAPNVWYYGGTAFSDVPALAIVLGASVLFLRGSYIPGCVLFGVAVGFRPQLALIAAVPWAMATWPALRGRERRRRVAPGLGLLLLIAGASYTGAAMASSSARDYVDAVREQQAYVARVDSFRSPTRPSLLSLTRTFFKPTRGGGGADRAIPVLAALGAAVALFRRRPYVWILLAMFGPMAIFSWLMLDLNAASRYVIAYIPMFALLAAGGLEALLRRETATVAVCGLVAVWFSVSAWGALRQVRVEEPPLLKAIRAVDRGVVYTTAGVVPFAEYYGRDVIDLAERPALSGDGYLLMDSLSSAPCARNFIRERGRLADIARARYFEASIVPAGGCE